MTKTTSLPLLSILAAFAVQACTAPTADDVSSDPMTPAPAPAEGSTTAANLAGTFGERPAAMSAGIEQPAAGQLNAGAEVYAQLFVASRNQTYDVHAYSFGIAGGAQALEGTKEVGRATLSDLNLTVAKNADVPSLSKDVFAGKPIGLVTLRQRNSAGTYVDVATFDMAMVMNVSASATGDGLTENVVIHAPKLRVHQGKSSVQVDTITGSASCAEPCPCADVAGQIGPYVQTLSSTVSVAKGAKRVESLVVSVSTEVQDPWYGAVTAPTPQLDGISMTSAFETSGMCAVYHAAKGNSLPSVKLGVAAYSTKEPRESTSWDACHAHVKGVSFSSRYNAMGQSIELGAAGLVRTDREWSSATYEPKSTTQGWSFAQNAPIASCAEML